MQDRAGSRTPPPGRSATARRAGTLRAGLAATLLLGGGIGCTGRPPDPAEIRIGVLVVLSGVPRETSGLPTIRGAEMAAAEANEQGGVRLGSTRHRVRLLMMEYEDRPDSATSVARTLVNQERIDLLVGPQFSRHAIPVSVVAESAQIPMLSPMSSNPATTMGKRFVFRLAFLDDAQARVMATFAATELRAKKAAVLYDVSTAYGRDLAAAFRATFESGGGKVAAFESYARDEPLDYRRQLERIRKERPDVLYLPNDTERSEAQIVQARAVGIDAVLLGGDTWDTQAFSPLPEADGAYATHQWHPALGTPEARRFVELYERAHGATPKVTAAMTYDAVRLALRALERAGRKDPVAVRDALAGTSSFTGVTGTIRFEGGPDPARSVVISEIRGRAVHLRKVVDPAPPP